MPLRVAAISFLNPAPLLYDFEHEPKATELRSRYDVEYTLPSECARRLLTGEADLGLIPIAALTPELAIIPGCTIASLDEVRSILLLVKNPEGLAAEEALQRVSTIAADAASRSSQAYTHLLFELWNATRPEFEEASADPLAMLEHHDAALLIGDPALFAREHRDAIDTKHADDKLLWLDLARLWRDHTGLPWVAAVWAFRPEALARENIAAAQVIGDLIDSRNAGMANTPALVDEWSPRLGLPRTVVQHYLTRNIHYVLDDECLATIRLFRKLAAENGTLPELGELNILKA
ncbi:menaquinone biosynthetic enzyme MqnA/MqnD family protein [Granulicella cerasi]|uniref:Chorismate dehydratase n=1 Tax=Granulicella cerasi TaxID=741063 RepID=A0ABW1ZD47_9BACT|nr:menaquinone biosynthesis protein [Granulicella cerasi]